MNILVAGATGYLGRYMVNQLILKGYNVKILVRNKNAINKNLDYMVPKLDESKIEVVEGDVTNKFSLQNICNDIDIVFSSVGITRQSDGLTNMDVDYQGNLNLLREAEKAEVKSFMYIHVHHSKNMEAPVYEAKELFVKELKSSKVNHIIISPTGYFSDTTVFLKMAAKGRIFILGNGTALMNPIHGEDLANFCEKKLNEKNSAYTVGGPQTFSYIDMANLAFKVVGKKAKITRIPKPIVKLTINFFKLFNPYTAGLVQFFYIAMTSNIVGGCTGLHKLEDFFREYSNQQDLYL